MIRSREELESLQRRVLEAERRKRDAQSLPAVVQADGEPAVALTTYARVTNVVTGDATYGPHLEVVVQRFTGTPPSPVDAGAVAVRCYPTPGRSVADYAVDEIVRLATASGAYVAEKPA